MPRCPSHAPASTTLRRRKLRQHLHAAFAVHTSTRAGPKPQRATAFTHLQIHTYFVLHILLHKAKFSPGEPQCYSAVGWARSGCYKAPHCTPKSLSMGSAGAHLRATLSSRRHAFLGRAQPAPSLTGPFARPLGDLFLPPVPSPRRYPAAFRKFQGYSPAKNPCQ